MREPHHGFLDLVTPEIRIADISSSDSEPTKVHKLTVCLGYSIIVNGLVASLGAICQVVKDKVHIAGL